MHTFTVLAILFTSSYAANILVINPAPSYSHVYFISTIYHELVKAGHNITALTPYPSTKNFTNLTEIKLHYDWLPDMNKNIKWNAYIFYTILDYYMTGICYVVYQNEGMQDLLKRGKFDLIIIEWYLVPCLTILRSHFSVPLIGIKSLGLKLEGHDAIGNPTNPSYISAAFNKHQTGFFGRMHEFLFAVYCRVHYNLFTKRRAQKIVDKYFEHARNIGDTEKEVDLLLCNVNYILNGVRPTVPAQIDIGLAHIGRRGMELPEDLKAYLNGNENVVLLNMGTLVRVNQELADIIIDVIKELPYSIIWKHDFDVQNLPKNIKIFNWLPQEAVLAHPNLKCFITHGGQLSFQEAVHYEVPMLTIPFAFDQPYVAYRVESLGIGRQLKLEEINKNNFKEALIDVTNNSSYKKNIQQVRKLVYDQPIKPMEKALWWIEYVIRNNGTPKMRSDALDLNWITYLNLDVVGVIFIILIISVRILRHIKNSIYFKMIRPNIPKKKDE